MSDLYRRLGVRTYVDLTATETIFGGAPMLPQVRDAMATLPPDSIVLDELMERVGARIADLLHAPAALVTSGAAGALTAATCACMAGGDPELAVALPDVAGLASRMIMPVESRSVFDQPLRATGARLVAVADDTELVAAFAEKPALVAMWAGAAGRQVITFERLVEVARRAEVPVVVDAAAELPARPNAWLDRGADLVCYSGGKILQGPQGAGLLLGRRDLVEAAWLHSAPHGTFGRMMKVSKEEIAGMLAAVEHLVAGRDLAAEFERWRGWYGEIAAAVGCVLGATTEIVERGGRSPYPILMVRWDPEVVPLSAGEVGARLRAGSPPVLSHAEGEGTEFMVRAVSMREGDQRVAARRLAEVLSVAAAGPPPAAPPADVSGDWRITMRFVAGEGRHRLSLRQAGARVSGRHDGTRSSGEVVGEVRGDGVTLRSVLSIEGANLTYRMSGQVDRSANTISGDVVLGEQLVDGFGVGSVTWRAEREEP